MKNNINPKNLILKLETLTNVTNLIYKKFAQTNASNSLDENVVKLYNAINDLYANEEIQDPITLETIIKREIGNDKKAEELVEAIQEIIDQNSPKQPSIEQLRDKSVTEISEQGSKITIGKPQTITPWANAIRNVQLDKVSNESLCLIETAINFAQAQQILTNSEATLIENDPKLTELGIKNAEFYRAGNSIFSVVMGIYPVTSQASQVFLDTEQATAEIPSLGDLRGTLRLIAEAQISEKYPNKHELRTDSINELSLKEIRELSYYQITPQGEVTKSQEFVLTGNNPKNRIKSMNAEIETVRQVRPKDLLIVVEKPYIPEGLNAGQDLALTHKEDGFLKLKEFKQSEKPAIIVDPINRAIKYNIDGNSMTPEEVINKISRCLREPSKETDQLATTLKTMIVNYQEKGQGKYLYINLRNSLNSMENMIELSNRRAENYREPQKSYKVRTTKGVER